jgi:hypothetical protein
MLKSPSKDQVVRPVAPVAGPREQELGETFGAASCTRAAVI